ncbi:MAG: aspartate-semialdehyde dehydrogenase [Acidobacteria bacterium]|nr:aspartate-semialdehyde dehydrogenase [Acidobacteriota bacterium]
MTRKLRAAVLGATGTVGQRFIQLLEDHPWFELGAIAASGRSVGKPYHRACSWKVPEPQPEYVRDQVLSPCRPGLEADFVFSGLPSSIAGEVECDFARAGYPVVSNSGYHRMEEDVPLLVPEINSDHLDLISLQQERTRSSGFIVTNPNCTTIALVLALAPLHRAFGLERVSVVTMQALSGAGYPGVAGLDVADNVLPYIEGEEEKVETEPLKILGNYKDGKVERAEFAISAQCHRVSVQDGHLEAVSVSVRLLPSLDELVETLASFRSLPQELDLPSAPRRPVVCLEEPDRPQPRLDRNLEKGMATVVGRIRPCPVLDYKFDLLGHNTIRGAAGAAILNAELLRARGMLKGKE